MPISLRWYDDNRTILLETFQGNWTTEDYRNLIDQAAEYLQSVQHTVHIIADATGNGPRLPANLLGGGILYAVRQVPANQGITVFVGVDAVTQMFIGFGRKLSPKLSNTLYSASSIENALTIIKRHTAQTK